MLAEGIAAILLGFNIAHVSDARLTHNVPAPPVSVQVMSESLCIDCQRFFQQSLIPAYRVLGPSVIDLSVVPFGNSRIDYDTKIVSCQHGEAECDANIWQECAVDQYPPPIYMDFFECLEKVLPMGHQDEPFEEEVFEKCSLSKRPVATTQSDAATMDFAKLKSCHDDPEKAWNLQAKYAKMTPTNHQFVPWVLVDHQYVDVDKEDFLQKVCQAYTSRGGSHPGCASSEEEKV